MIKLTCIECGLTDTLDKFIKDKRAAHGHRNKCRECERKRLRKYQRENRDKVNEANRKSYYKHREDRLAAQRKYGEENREKRSASARKRYLRNRDKILAQCAEYRRNNPKVQRAAKLRRRARERSLDFGLSTEELTGLLTRFDNKCAITGEVAEHLDHFIPLSIGHGGTLYENLIPLSATLNISKNNRNPFTRAKTLEKEERSNFERVVEYLAELNGLTVGEYQEFVFWCFENKREVDEITEENRDSLELWLRTKDAA